MSQPSLDHLPAAMSQYLPISIAAHWGWLAYGGVFLLMAGWLFLTRPRAALAPDGGMEARFRYVTARVLWMTLLFAVLDACAVNWFVLPPHGQGMPLLTSNWAFIAMAGMLIGLTLNRTQHENSPAL